MFHWGLFYPQPDVASRVHSLLSAAGIASGQDAKRGFDHGVFIPLKLMFADADVPIVQLSLDSSLDAAAHIAIGRALQPLRDEQVLIIGSGFITHDLSFRLSKSDAVAFVDSVAKALLDKSGGERDAALVDWAKLPAARAAHPREEHLVPLMVALGAAGGEARATRIATELAPPPLLFDSFRFD